MGDKYLVFLVEYYVSLFGVVSCYNVSQITVEQADCELSNCNFNVLVLVFQFNDVRVVFKVYRTGRKYTQDVLELPYYVFYHERPLAEEVFNRFILTIPVTCHSRDMIVADRALLFYY